MNETDTVRLPTEPQPAQNGAKKVFRRMGFALLTLAAVTAALQVLLSALVQGLVLSGYDAPDWTLWACTFIPVYGFGMPAALLILRRLPADERAPSRMSTRSFFRFLLMCFPLMYAGNLLGILLSSLLSGGSATNGLLTYANDSSPLKIVVMVVVAPLMEELLFRKQLIDRCVQYGEKTAVLFSGVTFALFHMNLFQMFYAFALGALFGYVYMRTRRLHYSVILHGIINFVGSVIGPLVASSSGTAASGLDALSQGEVPAVTPALLWTGLYSLAILALCIAGLAVLVTKGTKLPFYAAPQELPGKSVWKTVYCNAGVIAYAVFCLGICALNLFLS